MSHQIGREDQRSLLVALGYGLEDHQLGPGACDAFLTVPPCSTAILRHAPSNRLPPHFSPVLPAMVMGLGVVWVKHAVLKRGIKPCRAMGVDHHG